MKGREVSMDLKQLNYFVSVVNHMSFSKSGREVCIFLNHQLSNAIKNLERDLGFQIIERNTRNSRLTEDGGGFYTARAIHLLSEIAIVKKGNGRGKAHR